jgi:hypothetical protein
MTSTKFGCGMALCGACTVHVDGGATRSCITTDDSIGTSEITTIEAIGATPVGAARTGPGLSRERYLSSRGGRPRVTLRPKRPCRIRVPARRLRPWQRTRHPSACHSRRHYLRGGYTCFRWFAARAISGEIVVVEQHPAALERPPADTVVLNRNRRPHWAIRQRQRYRYVDGETGLDEKSLGPLQHDTCTKHEAEVPRNSEEGGALAGRSPPHEQRRRWRRRTGPRLRRGRCHPSRRWSARRSGRPGPPPRSARRALP